MTEESVIERRLRGALSDAANTLDSHTVRPLAAPLRARAFRSPLLVAAAVVLIASGVGYGTLVRQDDPPKTASPMSLQAAIVPSNGEIAIFLCRKDDAFESCQDSGPVTAADKQAIEMTVKRLRGVRSITFDNGMTAYRKFRQANKDNEALINMVQPGDMPESFRLLMEPGADRRGVYEAVKHLPGVSNVVDSLCLKQSSRNNCAMAAKPRAVG